jgi:hypothetical protein
MLLTLKTYPYVRAMKINIKRIAIVILFLAVIIVFVYKNTRSHHGSDSPSQIQSKVSTSTNRLEGVKLAAGQKSGSHHQEYDDLNLITEIEALLLISPSKRSVEQDYKLIELLKLLAEVNPEKVLEYIKKNPIIKVFAANRSILKEVWRIHPENVKDFVSHCVALRPIDNYFISDCLSCILSAPSNEDKEFVKQLIESDPDITADFLSYFGFGDINKAIQFRESLNIHGKQASEFDAAIAIALLESDPKSAIKYFGELSSSSGLTAKQRHLAMLLARDQPDLFADFVSKCSTASVGSILDFNFPELRESKNLAIYGLMLSKVPLTNTNLAHHKNYCLALAASDPAMAFQYLDMLPKGGVRDTITQQVIVGLYEINPQAAIVNLSNLNTSLQNKAAREICKNVATRSTQDALDIISKNPMLQKTDCYREVAKQAAFNDYSSAVKIIGDVKLSSSIGNDFRQEMINHTVQNWAKSDREAAKKWVEQLPVADQSKGVQGLVASWMKTDPIAASDWLSKQPAGPARDAGAQEIINQIKDTDPQMAEQWRKSMMPK